MNWDNFFKYLYKCFLISYLILWSLQLNTNQQKYLNIIKETLMTIFGSYLNIQPLIQGLGKQVIIYYSHFLIVVAVTVLFSWSISKFLTILVLLVNFLLLSVRKQLMFIGLDVILLAIVMQVDLKVQNTKKQKV